MALRHGGRLEASARRVLRPGLLELGDQAAAQIVDRARREEEPSVRLDLNVDGVIRRAAGFGKLLGETRLRERGLERRLRHRAGDDGANTVHILRRGADGLVRLEHDIEPDADSSPLALAVGAAGFREELFRRLVVRGSGAEHVRPLLAEEIALREALTGEGQLQPLHLGGGGTALVLNAAGIDVRDDADVFRTLHAALDLDAGDARVLERAQMVDKAVVLEAERIIVHAAAQRILHAAGLGAHAAVAAAAAD